MKPEAISTPPHRGQQQGLVIVFTGKGKGKTTAALGLVLRSWGRGMQVCVIQFIKARTGRWGEVRAAQKMGIEWHKVGDGFTWLSKDLSGSVASAQEGWRLAQEKIVHGAYNLVLLDEFTYPLRYGWLDTQEVLDWLGDHKPPSLHLVITGRDAPPDLIQFADLVTEMCLVKHPYEKGLPAQPGIEF